MTDDVTLLLLFSAATTASWLAVGLIRRVALTCNVVDVPNERSSHTIPIPSCGGLALVGINLVAWLLYGLGDSAMPQRHVLAFVGGSLILAGVSLADDLGHVPYPIRLGIQALAAIVFMFGFTYWQVLTVPLLGTVSLGKAGIVLSLLWIVGLTNAFNFMDGIDGLAAGQAVAAGFGWFVLGAIMGHSHLMILGVVLAATSLGFLKHNWHPATIFMGDVGSTFLGYSFAALAIFETQTDRRVAVAGVLLVWPIIFDASFTVLRRVLRRETIFAGHRTFLFHRLVAAGWTHREAASFYFVLPILGALLAFTWARGSPVLHASVGLFTLAACGALWITVRCQERRVLLASVIAGVFAKDRAVETIASAAFAATISAPLPVNLSWPANRLMARHGSSGVAWSDVVERRCGFDRRGGVDSPAQSRARERRSSCGRRSGDALVTATSATVRLRTGA